MILQLRSSICLSLRQFKHSKEKVKIFVACRTLGAYEKVGINMLHPHCVIK